MADFATRFRTRHPHLIDFLDDEEANAQADLLQSSGLDVLNERVLSSPRAEVLDVVAEHNMAAMLLRRGFAGVTYEPRSMQRPVDLVGGYAGSLYRIEVKRLGASEHDELHATAMHALNKALESSRGSILIQMQLGESFEAADLNGLVRHVKDAVRRPEMEQRYIFAADDEAVASYTLHPDSNARCPTLASSATSASCET